MLINDPSEKKGHVMKINKTVKAETSVSYTTPIETEAITLPIYCSFYFKYDGIEHTVIAEFKNE